MSRLWLGGRERGFKGMTKLFLSGEFVQFLKCNLSTSSNISKAGNEPGEPGINNWVNQLRCKKV